MGGIHGDRGQKKKQAAGRQKNCCASRTGLVHETSSANDDQEPGDVRGGSRRGPDHYRIGEGYPAARRTIRFWSADYIVAVVYRAVREFCGGHGGRARQGPGGHAAKSTRRNRGASFAARLIARSDCEFEAAFRRGGDSCGLRVYSWRRRSHRRRGFGG